MRNQNSLQRWFRILQLIVFAWIVIRFLMHLRDILSLRGVQKHKQQKPNLSNGILAGITNFIKERSKPTETQPR